MNKVRKITKQTNNRFLNMYDFEGVDRKNKPMHYFVASRAEKNEDLLVNQEEMTSVAVILYGIYEEEGEEKLVLIRQYRYTIDDYVYELPAGLIDQGESIYEAGEREFREETGLHFEPIKASEIYAKPFFTSVGLCDECCTTIYGRASGTISLDELEDSEDLEVVLASREMVREILATQKVAMPAGYSMLYFLASEKGKALALVKEDE